MAGVNKVIIVGNLGKDPEVRFMPNGGAVANLTVATSESWKDKQTGEQKEKTEWHRIVMFGKLAEIAGEYLKKGSKAYFEGQLQTRKWVNNDGQDQYTTEIVLQGFNGVMQMLDSKGSQGGGQQQGGFQGQQQGQPQGQPQGQQQGGYQQPAQQPQNQGQQQPAQPQQGGFANQAPLNQGQQQGQPQGGFANQGQGQGQPQGQQQGQPQPDYDDDIPF